MKFLNCYEHICVVFYMLVLRPIFGTSNTHIPSRHMNFDEYCGCICVVLDMLVLIPIVSTSTTHITSGHT